MEPRFENTLFKRSTMLIGITIFVVASLIIEVGLMRRINRKSSDNTITVLMNQVVSALEKNSENEEEIISELKDEYIVSAKTISYVLDKGTIDDDDRDELQKFAYMMGIDEVHLFDENGVIYAGTTPEYYGYSFDSGEQMAFFSPMLEDRTLSMCQDVTPNTAAGKSMMYAITWNESGTRMIQVGIEPKRLLEALNQNRIPNVLENIPSYEGLNIYVANIDSGEILGTTDETAYEKTLDEIGFPKKELDLSKDYNLNMNIDGYLCFCKFRQVEDMVVGIVYSTKTALPSFISIMLIELLYMLTASVIVFVSFDKWLLAQKAQNEHYAVLKSMSGIYYSMHLVDLEEDSVAVFKEKDDVKKISEANREVGAVSLMRKVIENVVVDNYMDKALEFTDLSTISERMRNKKIITAELLGKNIGWFIAAAIAIDSDEDGRPRKLVFTTRSIDGIKKREESLIKTSFTDELTKCYNRRAYEEDINGYQQGQTDDTLVYISMDVNGLKNINDTLGHAAGDELIKGASRCMNLCVAPYGKLYRTGGDEFVAIINADSDELDLILHDFDNEVSNWHGKLVDGMTVSYGYVCQNEDPNMSIKDMAILSDKRMYAAKSAHYRQTGNERRHQRDDHEMVYSFFTKILKANITYDTYEIISTDDNELTRDKGFSNKISKWMYDFGKSGQVHPDDLDSYLAQTDIDYLRHYFANTKSSLKIYYRRKVNGDYVNAMMEMVPANDFSEDNQSLNLFIVNIDR